MTYRWIKIINSRNPNGLYIYIYIGIYFPNNEKVSLSRNSFQS